MRASAEQEAISQARVEAFRAGLPLRSRVAALPLAVPAQSPLARAAELQERPARGRSRAVAPNRAARRERAARSVATPAVPLAVVKRLAGVVAPSAVRLALAGVATEAAAPGAGLPCSPSRAWRTHPARLAPL